MKISLRLSVFVVIFSMLSSFASAAVWIGGGIDNAASNCENWMGGVLPPFGDNVIFDNTSKENCMWDLNTGLLSLSIEGGYPNSLTVTSPLILSNGFAGEWVLFITDSSGLDQELLTFTQTGNNVFVAPGSDGDFTATFSGLNVTITNLDSGGVTTTYIGTISPDGTAMSGTESSSDGLHSGAWLATRTVHCTGYTYSDWGTCTNGWQSRTVTGYTPSVCTETPSDSPVLDQPCYPIILQANNEVNVPLNAKAIQYFKFTTPAGGCSKTLDITLINVSLTYGDGQLLVKSSNHGASSWPTLADYTYEFGLHGYTVGRDWTRDPNGGAFFWKWAIGVPGEVVSILPSYPTEDSSFSNDDTFYLLLYNQGTTQNNYRVKWQCYQ